MKQITSKKDKIKASQDAIEKIVKARTGLRKLQPFFMYLAMNLKLIEKPEVKTCAVDIKGNLYYSPEFINKLDVEQCTTLILHEIFHVVFDTFGRCVTRDKTIFNLASDVEINNMLKNNGFKFGGELNKGLVPQKENEITIFDENKKPIVTIKEIDKKLTEEVYNLLNIPKIKQKVQSMFGMSFDEVIFVDGDGNLKDKDGNPVKDENGNPIRLKEGEMEQLQKEWKKRLAEATAYGKQQGNLPAGMERFVEELLQSKLNWREILQKMITQEIIADYTYNRPSKKSQACGVYMPSTIKEMVDVCIAVDTSGSIGKEELTEFLSEIGAIGKSFNSIRMNIMFIDTDVNEHHVVDNGNIDDILSLKITGGGGTSFVHIYDYIEENIPNTKLLVFFTDLCCEFPKEEKIKTIWVATKNHADLKSVPFGDVIELKD